MPERKFKFVFNGSMVDVIGRALGKLPLEEAMPAYESFVTQIRQQNAPKAKAGLAAGVPPIVPKHMQPGGNGARLGQES